MGTSTATATTTAIIVPEDNEPDSHVISLEKLCLSEAVRLNSPPIIAPLFVLALTRLWTVLAR